MGVCHEAGAVVVFINNGWQELFHPEFVEDRAEVKGSLSGIGCGGEFSFSGAEGNGGLVAGFVKDGSTGEYKDDSGYEAVVLMVRSPVGVHIAAETMSAGGSREFG